MVVDTGEDLEEAVEVDVAVVSLFYPIIVNPVPSADGTNKDVIRRFHLF